MVFCALSRIGGLPKGYRILVASTHCDAEGRPAEPWVYVLISPKGNVITYSTDLDFLIDYAHDHAYAPEAADRVARCTNAGGEEFRYWIGPEAEREIERISKQLQNENEINLDPLGEGQPDRGPDSSSSLEP